MGSKWARMLAATAGVMVLLSGCIIFGNPQGYTLVDGDVNVLDLLYADVTGDGVDDLLVLVSDSTLHRLEPCGPGCLAPRQVITVTDAISPLTLDAADFDGDGTQDVVVKGFVLHVFFGSSGGPGRSPGLDESDATTIPLGSSSPIAGDLTGDSHADLGVLYNFQPGFEHVGYGIIRGDGEGGFGALEPVVLGLFDDAAFEVGLAMGDVDGEGVPEAIAWGHHTTTQPGETLNSITALSATGTIVASIEDPPGAGWLTGLVTGDLDGDGADDVAVGVGGQRGRASSIVLLRSTPPQFGPFGTSAEPTTLVPRTGVVELALADADADGFVDLFATPGFELDQPGWLSWWRGSATGIGTDGQPASRQDRQVPEPIAAMAFGHSGDPRPDLSLGQGGLPAVVYAMPNASR